MTTPNMNLTLPVVSTTPGPLWATEINQSLTTIDAHNHTSGNGALIPSAALSINADLSFAGNAATNLKGTVYVDIGSTPTFTNGVYVNSGDMYFRDGSGNAIPITISGAIAAAPGNIANLVAPANVSWNLNTATFIFTQNVNQSASIDVGPITTRLTSASSSGVIITPASGTTNWTLTLPSAVPAANSFVTASTSGAFGYISQTSGIIGSMIASSTITTNKLAALTNVSSITGSTSVTSSSFQQVGNSASITTVGRNGFSTIAYTLQSVDATTLGSIELKNTVDSLVSAELRMSITDVATSTEYIHNLQSIIAPMLATPGRFFRYPLSSYSGIWQIGFSGQFLLKLQARITSGSGTVSVYNFQIFAYEV